MMPSTASLECLQTLSLSLVSHPHTHALIFTQHNTQSVKEMLLFLTKTFTKRTEPGQRQSVEHEGYVVHCYVPQRWTGRDRHYGPRVPRPQWRLSCWASCWRTFAPNTAMPGRRRRHPSPWFFPKAEEYLQKYQNPAEADKVTKIQKDLDETTQILHKTIDSVLERGVKLDNLVDKSNDLSAQSKLFYKSAKKTNSCCVVS